MCAVKATPECAGDRALIVLSACVALYAILGRIHNAASFPPMADWDASAHAVSLIDVLSLHVPNPRSWAGTHPPLYYALGAVLCRLLPESVPMHVTMRLLSSGAWVGTVVLVRRALRSLVNPVDTAVVGALLLGVPGLVIITGMMTNDAVCAFFMTATLVRLLEAPRDEQPRAGQVAAAGFLAALAALTKATGLPAVAISAAFYAWRSRRRPWQAVRNVLIIGVIAAVIAGPHYARIALTFAGARADELAPQSPAHLAPYDKLAGFSGSKEKEAISLVVLAVMSKQAPDVPSTTLLHQAIWGDPTAVFLPRDASMPGRALAAAGLVVLGVALAGAARLLLRRDIARRAAVVCAFGLSYAAALVPPALIAPYMVLTKTNFFLPLALPVGLVLAVGLDGLPRRARTTLRLLLLVIAAGGVTLTWYGWWEPAGPTAPAPAGRPTSGPSSVRAVERYLASRAHDPIRAVAMTTPEVQLAHGLRLVRILGVPFTPERGLTPENERAIEVSRARQASLESYNLFRWMAPLAGATRAEILAIDEQGDTANVGVRVDAGESAPPQETTVWGPWPFKPFELRFTLRRVDGAWRITSIEQAGVSWSNAAPAFAVDATLAGLDRLRALGWRPGKEWEDAVAASVQSFPGLR